MPGVCAYVHACIYDCIYEMFKCTVRSSCQSVSGNDFYKGMWEKKYFPIFFSIQWMMVISGGMNQCSRKSKPTNEWRKRSRWYIDWRGNGKKINLSTVKLSTASRILVLIGFFFVERNAKFNYNWYLPEHWANKMWNNRFYSIKSNQIGNKNQWKTSTS